MVVLFTTGLAEETLPPVGPTAVVVPDAVGPVTAVVPLVPPGPTAVVELEKLLMVPVEELGAEEVVVAPALIWVPPLLIGALLL